MSRKDCRSKRQNRVHRRASLKLARTSAPEVRQEQVDAIREQIAAGTYETPEKLDKAVDRLLDEIG